MNWRIEVLQTSALPLGYSAILERKTGFEPATFTLARWHSTVESFPQMVARPGIEPGTRGFSVLCSTDWAIWPSWGLLKWRPRRGSNPRPPAWQAGTLTNWATGPLCGGHNRDRTCDPLLVRQMLSQLSYAPTKVSQDNYDYIMINYNCQ